MWFFFRRARDRQQAREQTPIPKPRPLSYQQIAQSFDDFSDFTYNNATLKFWLPAPAEEALTEFCQVADQSLSEWLRQFFTVYSYGLVALTLIQERRPGFLRDEYAPRFSKASPPAPPGKKRVHTYWVLELGKNIAPIKVWIPTRLKDDLQLLADHAGLPLSQFVREIVISRLLGHGTLPARPILTCAEPTVADGWCEDEDVPWRQVSAEEYRDARAGEVRWHYEDEADGEDPAV